MLEIRKYKDIGKVQSIWQEMCIKNPELPPYMYYYYNKCIFDFYSFYKLRTFQTPVFYVILKDGDPILIAPLTKKIARNKFGLLGDIQGSDSIDFIYNKDISLELFSLSIETLIKHLNAPVSFSRITKSSLLLKMIEKKYPQLKVKRYPHVNIRFQDSFEEYIKGLSKNSRQNIRTAFNRLGKDNLNAELRIACSNDEISNCLDVYYARQMNHYNMHSRIRRCLSEYIGRHLKHDTISLTTSDNKFIPYLIIGNEIAGCIFGLKNNDNTLITIPRLAINEKFIRYSPGNLLIYKCIEYLINNTTIRNMDLSRGDERYKYVMGGAEYYTYSFEL